MAKITDVLLVAPSIISFDEISGTCFDVGTSLEVGTIFEGGTSLAFGTSLECHGRLETYSWPKLGTILLVVPSINSFN